MDAQCLAGQNLNALPYPLHLAPSPPRSTLHPTGRPQCDLRWPQHQTSSAQDVSWFWGCLRWGGAARIPVYKETRWQSTATAQEGGRTVTIEGRWKVGVSMGGLPSRDRVQDCGCAQGG